MEAVLHVPDLEYAARLMAESQYYVLTNRIEKYVKENNLTDVEKKYIYEQIIKDIDEF